MNTVIKLLIIASLISGCQLVVDACDPEEMLPYSKSDLIYELHCSKKCCEFVVHEEPDDLMSETCHEMWCFRDCEWTMNHKSCY
jgi:hypothetical protein